METRRCGFGFLRQVKPRSPVGNIAQTCRCQRYGKLRRGDGVVDSADEFGRQGYGRQATRHYFESAARLRSPAVICCRPEYSLPKNLGAASLARPGSESIFCQPRGRARHRVARGFRARRTAAPDSRVRLWRSGIGERVRRSAPGKQESFRETSAKTEARNYSLSARR